MQRPPGLVNSALSLPLPSPQSITHARTSLSCPSSKLIEPDEPLALRLSSNLMVGIARVHAQQVSDFPPTQSSPFLRP